MFPRRAAPGRGREPSQRINHISGEESICSIQADREPSQSPAETDIRSTVRNKKTSK